MIYRLFALFLFLFLNSYLLKLLIAPYLTILLGLCKDYLVICNYFLLLIVKHA